jgi:hypothetical protein
VRVYLASAIVSVKSAGTIYRVPAVERSNVVNRLYAPRQRALDVVDDGTDRGIASIQIDLRVTPMDEVGVDTSWPIHFAKDSFVE